MSRWTRVALLITVWIIKNNKSIVKIMVKLTVVWLFRLRNIRWCYCSLKLAHWTGHALGWRLALQAGDFYHHRRGVGAWERARARRAAGAMRVDDCLAVTQQHCCVRLLGLHGRLHCLHIHHMQLVIICRAALTLQAELPRPCTPR